MRPLVVVTGVTLASCFALVLSVFGAGEGESPDPKKVRASWSPFVKPLAEDAVKIDADQALIDLGRRLFYDRRLSAERSVSCNDCHSLGDYGTSGKVALELQEERKLRRDVPGLYNIAKLIHFGWDGSVRTLKEQVSASLTSKEEMGMADAGKVTERLKSITDYKARFEKAFPESKEPVDAENAAEALTVFISGLVTRAPFDKFLLGDDKALTDQQLRGAQLFDRMECGACHTGTSFGGQMLQKVGIIRPWPNQEDQGYYEFSKKSEHKMVFKVPPLRNVEKTAPYFHDYSARSLRRAIKMMAYYERGQDLGYDQILDIEAFLNSLTGEIPEDYIRPPADMVEGGE